MQFDIDMQGIHAEIFRKTRKIILGYEGMIEIRNGKQTSYRDAYSMIVMLRGRGKEFILSFGNGVKLQELYPTLKGNGKIVRHLAFSSIHDLDEVMLRGLIEESLILNMERYEMKELRKIL